VGTGPTNFKTYWMNLIIETEKAIKLLDSKSQNAFHILASKKLKQIYRPVPTQT
jgi:hypothetical protein